MSRSYKKTPYCTDHTARTTKQKKQCANSKVRKCRDENIPTHKRAWFKRVFEQYDICDYKNYWSKTSAIQRWYKEEEEQISKNKKVEDGWYHKRYRTLENYIQNSWHKNFKRK